MRRFSFLSIFLIIFLIIAGCATIEHGDSQYIEINSQPQGATAYINGKPYQTPAKVLLKRGAPQIDYDIILEKEGYKPSYVTLERTLFSKIFWGNIIWCILPGMALDFYTGAAYELTPSKINIQLQPSAH